MQVLTNGDMLRGTGEGFDHKADEYGWNLSNATTKLSLQLCISR